ncbi:MAG: DUF4129 domain-containing protein [Planctomycetia bacterium]|nr:DUF4129 domain-containing protein [Planctomycetia bacterium]
MERFALAAHAPSEVRAKAAEIVARDEYKLEAVKGDATWHLDILSELIYWILKPFRWIFSLTEGLPEALRWVIVIVLGVLLLLITSHIVYSIFQSLDNRKRVASLTDKNAHRRLDPRKLEGLADEAAAQRDFITAVRLLFRAGVLRLEQQENKPHRPGTTNRELLRRYQKQPALGDLLRLFVDMIDRKWYGDEVCTDGDYAACRSAHDDLCRLTRRKPDVHGA